jgi:hypothetical protein
MGPQPEHVLLESDAKEFARGVGFEVANDIDVGAYHYGFIARKHE